MKKTVIALLAAALIAGAAFAQVPPQHARPQVLLAQYLQLTQDQITAWKQIDSDTASAVKPLATQERDLNQQLHTALQATAPDAAAVGKLAVSAAAVRAQIKTLRDNAKSKRIAVLNADQKSKYDAFEAALQFIRQQRPRPGA